MDVFDQNAFGSTHFSDPFLDDPYTDHQVFTFAGFFQIFIVLAAVCAMVGRRRFEAARPVD